MFDIFNSAIEAQADETVTYFPIRGAYAIAPILSSISTVVAIILCLTTKSAKHPLTRMIIAINLSDFLFTFPKVIPVLIGESWYCDLIQVVSRFGVISCVVWSTLFAHAFMTIVQHVQMEVIDKRFKYYVIIGVVLPAAAGLTALAGEMEYDGSNHSCDHAVANGYFDWEDFVFFAIPIMVGCFYSCYLYIKTARRLKNFVREGHEKYVFTLILYPGILIICWGPSLFLNFLYAVRVPVNINVTKFFQAWDQLQGFFNGLAYTGSRQIVLNACKRRFRCKKKKASRLLAAEEEREHHIEGHDHNEEQDFLDRPDSSPGRHFSFGENDSFNSSPK